MGFDNECILNIQSLPGEYFCPVCRTLVYPNEALQSQCTHLYCKPCLAYIVATTQACPYDGYLVTEADSKPLMESNKTLAETVGKVAVHCLYHRSGCQWQGTLSDCITHCSGCSFGNSPVVCNRCGTQIIHRQVQEHAQICPGLQLQAQQVENTQVQASTVATQAAQDQSAGATSAVTIATVASSATPVATATQATSATTSTATVTMAATAATPATPSVSMAAAPAPASVPTANLSSGQGQTQVKAAAYQQAVAQAPTADQWYQQQQLQYQQYYQQYPGYNPYQQYQQYGQYQQAYQQYAQPQMQAASQQVVQGQQQPSPYIMPQPNAQQQPQPQPHPLPQQLSQPQVQPQAQVAQLQSNQQNVQLQPQPQPNGQVQQMQAPQSHVPPQQPLPQTQPPAHPPSGAQVAGQQFGQPLPQPQPHAPAQPVQQLQPPPYQQLLPTQQHPLQQPPNLQPHPQQQPHAQPQLQAQPVAHPQPHFQQHMQLQPHSQPQLNAQVQPQPLPQAQLPQLQPSHPSLHAVTGHQSYQQPQPVHQFPPGAPQQHPIHMHPQQQGIPQHAVKMNNQLVPQQTPQMRPPQGQFPGQVQQQSTMLPPQGPHANIQQPQQQQPHHLVSHHAQMVQQHPGIQSHASQQGLQPQQAHAPLQPGQPYQHGMLPSQPPLQQQQPMRPHGPPYLQQQIPGQSYSQQNAPQGQGLPPAHQAQVVAGRPTLMMNHGMPQQPFQHSPRGPSKYVQPGVTNQQLPMVRSSTHMPTAPELQGAPPHSAGQGALIPTSTASAKPTKDVPEIGKKIIPKNTEGAEKGDANHVEIEGSVYTGSGTLSSGSVREGKAEGEAKEKKSIKDASELAQLVESDEAEALANKPGMKEEVTDPPREGTDSSLPLKDSHRENENKSIEDTPSEKPGAQPEGNDTYAQSDDGKVQSTKPPMPDELGSHMDNTSQSNISQDQEIGNIAGNMQASQQMPAPGGSFPQPGYHSGHPPEFARQGPVSGVVQGMTPSGPIPGHERYPPPYAHPSSMTDTAQRPPGPAQHMQHPGATHERRFQEPPPPYFMHAHRETYPQPPPGQQPYGSFHAEVATRSSGPQVPSHINVGGIRPHGESLIRPAMGGPPPGVFDTTRGPPFGPEDQVGRPRPVNALEAESYAARGPGFSDGRQPEPPFVQSGIAKVNGMVGKGPMHGSSFREERIRSLPEDGFNTVVDENLRPYPVDPSRRNVSRRDFEEDLKQFPRPAHLDGEGLSKFDGYISSSRPLDRAPGRSEGVPGVLPVRPLLPYQSSGPFPSGSAASDQRPMDIGERHRHVGFHEDFGRRPDPISGHPDLLRSGAEFGHHRMDGLPPLRSPGREYGGIPSGRFGLGNQHRFEDFDGREPRGFVERSKGVNFPPDHFLRGIPDGPGSLRNMDRLDLDGPNVPRSHFRPGDRNFPSFLRGGEYLGQGPLRLGDPTGYGGNYSRHGFPNEAGHFSSVSLRGEMDTFEHPRKRIAASMGWCRICRVDCETVEGLDLHSQTREHQKMAMDMIISIKQEVGKKQKLNSDDQASIDDTNKSRKANFENRGNRP